jgi:RNA polymerase sigma factor (sigma-70 family)
MADADRSPPRGSADPRSSPHLALWEGLYAQHADRILAYARRRVPVEDAQDVVVETFTVAWRRIDRVPEDALPWLYGVARNVVTNMRRSATRFEALRTKLGRLADRPPFQSPEIDVVEGADAVSAALAALTETEREALILTVWEDLEPRRAAVVLGCSVGAFNVRVHRAKQRLREILERADPDDRWEGGTDDGPR